MFLHFVNAVQCLTPVEYVLFVFCDILEFNANERSDGNEDGLILNL